MKKQEIVINEREIAVYALIDIINESGYSSIILKKALKRTNALKPVQKAFITEAVNGVLRNIIYIDYIINHFSNIKTDKMKPVILNTIRLAVYQIIFMDKVPDSAACNEAVNFIKRLNMGKLSGFVNGVVRNIIRDYKNVIFPDVKTEPVKFLSVMYSYPEWLIKRFTDLYGYDETIEMLKINNTAPTVTLCVNTTKTTVSDLKNVLVKEGVSVHEGKFLDFCLHVHKTSDISKLESFKNGLYHIMDESAALVSVIANPKPGQKIIDLCAAPGGKSFALAYLSNDEADIFSYDIFEHKIELIKQGAERLGLTSVKAGISDGSIYDEKKAETADILILDVPCSGLGLLRKKPDTKIKKSEKDITDLAALQKNIISASWQYVKKGGTLIYSTCTLSREENEDNISWILENFPFEQQEIKKILPHHFGTDGFFIAKLKRKI